MNPDRWRQVEAACHRALARAPAERRAFLDEACAGDADLRREVESLMAQASKVREFLETPAARAPGAEPAGGRPAGEVAVALSPGARLGPYEIAAFVGAGGMGEVYQARDTRLGRPVAIKVLPPGLAADAERRQVYVRDLQEIDARPLAGTEAAGNPFFSPDGRWIGFGAGGKLKKVALDGGAVVTFADAPQFRGGSWGDDGTILFSRGGPGAGLLRVSAGGGEPEEVTRPDPALRELDHRWPQHLPGGRAALFDITSEALEHGVGAIDLETGRRRVLVENASSPRWSPTGHLLFGRHGIVYAAPLDPQRLGQADRGTWLRPYRADRSTTSVEVEPRASASCLPSRDHAKL